MIAKQSFTFKFNNVKKLWYLLFCFAGVPLTLLLGRNASFAVFLLTILAPMILAFIFVIKKMRVQESVEIGDNYLDSDYYGKVSFSEIYQITSTNLWARPNLIIKLKDGRRLKWITVSNITTNENYVGLQAFIDGFSEAILTAGSSAQASGSAAKGHDFSKTNKSPDQGSFDVATPGLRPDLDEKMDPDAYEELKEDVRAVKSGNSTASKIAIPISLGLALIGFFRYYIGPKIAESKNHKVAEMFQRGREENRLLKEKALDFIQQYQHQKGPFYLFSNDRTAQLHYLPDIQSPDGYEGPLSYVFESDSLRKLLASPDSMSWNIYVKTSNNKIYGLRKNIMNTNDSTDTYVYLTEIVPDIKTLPPASIFNSGKATPDEPDSIPTQLTFVVPLYPQNSIRQNLEDGTIGYKMFLSLFTHHSKTTQLYIAGRQGEGRMDKALFEKVVSSIKSDLHKQGADTSLLLLRQID